jgi:preprotein translocase subunit SecF
LGWIVIRNKGIHARLHKKEAVVEQVQEEKAPKKVQRRSAPTERSLFAWFEYSYSSYQMVMLIIPLLLFLLCLGQVGYHYATTGSYFDKDVSLAGGLSLTLHREGLQHATLEQSLINTFGAGEVSVRALRQAGIDIGIIVEMRDETKDKELISALDAELGTLSIDEYSIEITGSSLGNSFFSQLLKALGLAFVFMAIVVFIYFRSPAPSIAVILATLFNIIDTIAILNLLDVQISGAGIAAILMLIGYSVDTEMLMSSRVHQRGENSLYQAVYSALKPGLLMTFTTLTTVTLALFFTQSPVISQIMLIILIGLLVDLINTWVFNTSFMIRYYERKGAH